MKRIEVIQTKENEQDKFTILSERTRGCSNKPDRFSGGYWQCEGHVHWFAGMPLKIMKLLLVWPNAWVARPNGGFMPVAKYCLEYAQVDWEEGSFTI